MIVNSTQCATENLTGTSLKCIWVTEEEEENECQEIKETCEEITERQTTCNHEGVSEEGRCLWVLDSEGEEGSCEKIVCL
jgi:hypothetical protein